MMIKCGHNSFMCMLKDRFNFNRKISIATLMTNILKKWYLFAFLVLLYFAYTAIRQTNLNKANYHFFNECRENIASLDEKIGSIDYDLTALQTFWNQKDSFGSNGFFVVSKRILISNNKNTNDKFISNLSLDNLEIEWATFDLAHEYKTPDLLRYFVELEKKEDSLTIRCLSDSIESANVVVNSISHKIEENFFADNSSSNATIIINKKECYTADKTEIGKRIFYKGIEKLENKEMEAESEKQNAIKYLSENETNLLDWLLWTAEISIKLFAIVFVLYLLYAAISDIVLSADEFIKNYNQYQDVIELKQLKSKRTLKNAPGLKEKHLYIYETGFNIALLQDRYNGIELLNLDDLNKEKCNGIKECFLCIRRNKTTYSRINDVSRLLNENEIQLSTVIVQ